jgi:FkbM family methyltransferase
MAAGQMRPQILDNNCSGSTAFVERVDRAARLRCFLLRRLLRFHKHDFATYGRIAAIVGDDIGDQLRIFGRYENTQLRAIAALILPHIPSSSDCIDVGANIGNHSIFFSKYFERVVAFEPNPVARALLELNIRLNRVRNVEIRTAGLSDKRGSEHLSVCIDNLGASRLRFHSGDAAGFSRRVSEEIEITLTTGDDALNCDRPVGLVKIDVEGHEANVLLGLRNTIEAHRPAIVLEQLASAIDVNCRASATSAIMQRFGYRAFEIRRVPRTRLKRLNDLLTYLCGTLRHVLVPVTNFEQRHYPVLLYLHEGFVTSLTRNRDRDRLKVACCTPGHTQGRDYPSEG